jgi:hypothetical protein
MNKLLNKSKNYEDEEERDSSAENKVKQLSFDGPSEISWVNHKAPPNKDAIMDSEDIYEMQKLVAQRIINLERAMNRLNRAKNNKSRDPLLNSLRVRL